MDQQLSLFYGLSFLTAAAAFVFAVYLYLWVKKQPLVNKTIEEVAGLIRAGANTFMGREYKILAVFAIVIAVVLFVLLPSPVWKDANISDNIAMAIAYLFGTVLSAIAGKIGLLVASLSNGRCAEAADKGIVPSFLIGYRGGSVMGLLVVGCALLGVSLVLSIVGDATILLGFSFGASSLALFAKAGGGIFTKTADVAADLTGKVELGIPEDDPRNPPLSLTTLATTSATSPAWALTCSTPTSLLWPLLWFWRSLSPAASSTTCPWSSAMALWA